MSQLIDKIKIEKLVIKNILNKCKKVWKSKCVLKLYM